MPHALRFELARPDELEATIREAPVAYLPLGTFEHHGWHLPVGFDGIKAHALCLRVAERTGGAVLPAFFYGVGGGHVGFPWTILADEAPVGNLLAGTIDGLVAFGFRVIVLLTGHYPGEQVALVRRLAQAAEARHPGLRCLGLPEHAYCTPDGDDSFPGDHAAKYETSLALALDGGWTQRERLTPGRDPARHALPATPRSGPLGPAFYDPTDPLYAIAGQDPRLHADRLLGERLVEQVVAGLAAEVATARSAA